VTEQMIDVPSRWALRRGDRVRVRSRDEILASLDTDGTLDGLPFMPEMLEYCGRELPVQARADKTCDTINATGTTRALLDTVHLAGARCDGGAHGGCQAGCLLFWREAWLEPAGATATAPDPAPTWSAPSEKLAAGATRINDAGEQVYRCQATELLKASRHLRRRDLSQFVRDVRTRNVPLRTMLVGLPVEAFNSFQWIATHRLPRWLRPFGGREFPFVRGTGTGARTRAAGLRPGDLVEVKSKAEIMATLDAGNRNRGMLFDAEMLRYCGRRFRVQAKVSRILDEATGKMIKLGDCYILEDVVCQGIYHRFCPRAITPYWREAWLRRVEG
jgi:hypothetical protein